MISKEQQAVWEVQHNNWKQLPITKLLADNIDKRRDSLIKYLAENPNAENNVVRAYLGQIYALNTIKEAIYDSTKFIPQS